MDKNGRQSAFLWRKGTLVELKGLGGTYSEASAINNHGQVTCVVSRVDGGRVPCLWDQGQPKEIALRYASPPLNFDSNRVTVSGINDRGQVIGFVMGRWLSAAFLWEEGKGVNAHTRVFATFPSETLRAINDRGQITGTVDEAPDEPPRAVLWDGDQMRELGTLSASEADMEPRSINNRGHMVGIAPARGTEHAFLWNGTRMLDLGTLVDGESEANAINDTDQVVGTGEIEWGARHGFTHMAGRATLWQNGRAYDLNNCIPKDSGWILERALAINESGQIVGIGYGNSDTGEGQERTYRGFLLTPLR